MLVPVPTVTLSSSSSSSLTSPSSSSSSSCFSVPTSSWHWLRNPDPTPSRGPAFPRQEITTNRGTISALNTNPLLLLPVLTTPVTSAASTTTILAALPSQSSDANLGTEVTIQPVIQTNGSQHVTSATTCNSQNDYRFSVQPASYLWPSPPISSPSLLPPETLVSSSSPPPLPSGTQPLQIQLEEDQIEEANHHHHEQQPNFALVEELDTAFLTEIPSTLVELADHLNGHCLTSLGHHASDHPDPTYDPVFQSIEDRSGLLPNDQSELGIAPNSEFGLTPTHVVHLDGTDLLGARIQLGYSNGQLNEEPPNHHPPHPQQNFDQQRSLVHPNSHTHESHHQWDIKDVKLPKVERFDPYEQWPTGHCRRIYAQSCERARRHQSGWAMRNTNNHNPQVLKKSCLGVLECSAGCLVQGKPLSLRPAICDKARKKQCNRRCITPGCSGRLILRTCRGHSGYPVTHFWRFANGAVYFEAKGEHDHNRPSLKTFGLSEPEQTVEQPKSFLTETNGSLAMAPSLMKTDQVETVGRDMDTRDRLGFEQSYVGLWNSVETQHQMGRSRCGMSTGRGKSHTRGGINRMGRREKKMNKQKTSKSHHFQLTSLLQTPMEHRTTRNESLKQRTCDIITKTPTYLPTPCSSQPNVSDSSALTFVQSIDLSHYPTQPLAPVNPTPTMVTAVDPVWYESHPDCPPASYPPANLVPVHSWPNHNSFPTQPSIDLNQPNQLHSSTNQFEPQQMESNQPVQLHILPTFWQLATGNDLPVQTFDQPNPNFQPGPEYGPNHQTLEPTNSPNSSPNWSPSTSSLSSCSSKAIANSTMAIAGSVVHSTEFVQHQHQHPVSCHQQSNGVSYTDTQELVINSLSTTGSPGLPNDSGLSSLEWITSTQVGQWFDEASTPTTVSAMAFSTPSIDPSKDQSGINKPDQQSWLYQDSNSRPLKVSIPDRRDPYYTAYCLDDTLHWFSVGQQQQRHQQTSFESTNTNKPSNVLEIVSESSPFGQNYQLVNEPDFGALISHNPYPIDHFETSTQPNPSDSSSESFSQPVNMIPIEYDSISKIPALADNSNNSDTYFVTESQQFETWPSLNGQTSTCVTSHGNHNDGHFVYSHDCFNQLADSRGAQFEMTSWTNGTTTDYAFYRQCD